MIRHYKGLLLGIWGGCIISSFVGWSTLPAFADETSLEAPIDVNYNALSQRTVDLNDFGDFSSKQNMGQLLQQILLFFMSLLGTAGLIGIIVGGIMVMSGGVSESGKENGKTLILYSVIGVSVAILSVVITTFAQSFLYFLGT